MKKNKKARLVISNYDRSEEFDLNSIPEHFDSVTDEALKNTQRTALEKAGQVTNFTPGALDNALMSADGQFEGAYAILEGDYGQRLTNLRNVYKDGLSDIRKMLHAYKLQVAQYNIAFKNYSDANRVINDVALPENLIMSDDDTNKIEKMIEDLK